MHKQPSDTDQSRADPVTVAEETPKGPSRNKTSCSATQRKTRSVSIISRARGMVKKAKDTMGSCLIWRTMKKKLLLLFGLCDYFQGSAVFSMRHFQEKWEKTSEGDGGGGYKSSVTSHLWPRTIWGEKEFLSDMWFWCSRSLGGLSFFLQKCLSIDILLPLRAVLRSPHCREIFLIVGLIHCKKGQGKSNFYIYHISCTRKTQCTWHKKHVKCIGIGGDWFKNERRERHK